MGAALAIRDDLTAADLRRHARFEPNRRAALRMLAIANALEGLSRAEAARLTGMERQALRDPGITVAEVARRLRVAPSTLYRHLPGGRAGLAEREARRADPA